MSHLLDQKPFWTYLKFYFNGNRLRFNPNYYFSLVYIDISILSRATSLPDEEINPVTSNAHWSATIHIMTLLNFTLLVWIVVFILYFCRSEIYILLLLLLSIITWCAYNLLTESNWTCISPKTSIQVLSWHFMLLRKEFKSKNSHTPRLWVIRNGIEWDISQV